ncbi:hypothetical protein HMPREF3214_00717 [Alloscardovia omnicolens]|uniref:Uncharacterized protein n=1 Tax=Alloscardovia omnicolens F0580 TaxID=1321816 RepID=U1RA49_9BIFI|nr:hypothetical protein HMPREF9244_00824 [Alloscardovia omnicolens F0580]KWZ74604.1 hypothetical protein HMPREF3214_00717 [Alloscardovia omnicolens]
MSSGEFSSGERATWRAAYRAAQASPQPIGSSARISHLLI